MHPTKQIKSTEMKGKYYCEMESPIYREIIAEKLRFEGKLLKGKKKGKRCVK